MSFSVSHIPRYNYTIYVPFYDTFVIEKLNDFKTYTNFIKNVCNEAQKNLGSTFLLEIFKNEEYSKSCFTVFKLENLGNNKVQYFSIRVHYFIIDIRSDNKDLIILLIDVLNEGIEGLKRFKKRNYAEIDNVLNHKLKGLEVASEVFGFLGHEYDPKTQPPDTTFHGEEGRPFKRLKKGE